MKIFSNIKDRIFSRKKEEFEDFGEDYVEINTEKEIGQKAKVVVKPFVIENFEDIKETLDALREGYTIALINIKPIKDKDIVELKRAVNKLKKTCDAIEGEIAGFGEDYIVVTPGFAKIHRSKQTAKINSELISFIFYFLYFYLIS